MVGAPHTPCCMMRMRRPFIPPPCGARGEQSSLSRWHFVSASERRAGWGLREKAPTLAFGLPSPHSLTLAGEESNSLRPARIVGRLARDRHVVDVAFAQ